jgi:hypothetical protein
MALSFQDPSALPETTQALSPSSARPDHLGPERDLPP